MNDFKFSVAMCVYHGDEAKYFKQALESIYQQTLLPDELILVVDGPITEELEKVIDFYKTKPNFYIYRLDINRGHGIARNLSIEKCKNNFIAIVDADDVNEKSRFEKQINVYKKDPELAVVSSGCFHFEENIKEIINVENLPETDKDIKKVMKTRCAICQAAAMVNKKWLEKVGGYIDWYYAEDYYLWIRLHIAGARFYNCPEPLLYVRTNQKQMARRGGVKYFKSLSELYFFMYKKGVINLLELYFNVLTRFILQILLPEKARFYVRKFFL